MGLELMLPVGRMVGGSMYTPQLRTNDQGQPVINPTTGKQDESYSFGYAIQKHGEQHWNQTQWGAQIWGVGQQAYAAQIQAPTFAWKITDGDSQIPNKKGKRPCDQAGHPGHWILWFSQGWKPKLVNQDGTVELTDPDAVLPGYFIQVYADIAPNKPRPGASHTPGLYLNPLAVAFVAYGERIQTNSIDTKGLGFGQGQALPPGASTVPIGGMSPAQAQYSHGQQPSPPPPGAYPQHQAPAPQGSYPVTGAGGQPYPNPPVGQTYAPGVTNDGLPHHPAPPPPPNAAFLKTMTPAAGGVPYESFIAQGWTDDAMRQAGYLV